MEKIIFLILSFMTGVLELGVLWHRASVGDSLLEALALVLAYQLGNLAVVKKGRFTLRALVSAVIGALMLLSLIVFPLNTMEKLIGESMVVFCSSLAIQTARERFKSRCTTGSKRLSRILGFVVSPIMIYCPYIVLLISLLFSAAFLTKKELVAESKEKGETKVIPAMVFHQMHYFVYSYVFLWWLNNLIKAKGAIATEWIVACGFALTWLVYMMPEVISRTRKKDKYQLHFIVGHGLLLMTMALSSLFAGVGLNIPLIILWVATGIGGGTVYAIPKLTCKYRNTDMKLSEDLGHVLGVVAAIGAYIMCGYACYIGVFLTLAAVFVAITLAFAITDIMKERKKV